MKKKILLLCICLSVCLCACQKAVPLNESVSKETEQRVVQEDELLQPDMNGSTIEASGTNMYGEDMTFLEQYEDFWDKERLQRAALIYLDEDSIPELLILENGEYSLYLFDGSEVKAVSMPSAEIKANAYGSRYDLERLEYPEYQTFYWFEYVPHKGLLRVHCDTDQERHDYYLRYTNGLLLTEFEAKSIDYTWHTYNAEKEISNEEFLSRLTDLGYDKLVPCGYLYEDVKTAYENIDVTSDTKKVLDNFVNQKIDAMDYVEGISDIPEDNFVMRSYKDYYDDITAGEEDWGSVEYVDFDNDGEAELILHGYCGACLFFDVIGDTVYKVIRTGSTTDVAYVAEIENKRVIVRTDLTHGGRLSYRIMAYDSCCCLIDWFHLYAGYEGASYSNDDKFMYRDNAISMEEFEIILNSIQWL